LPRYETGKVYGAFPRAEGRADRPGSRGRSPVRTGRRVKAGTPVGGRPRAAQGAGRVRRSASERRRRPRRWVRTALFVLTAGVLAALAGYTTVKAVLVSQFVRVVLAHEGRVEDVVHGQAYIIRHEVVLRSPVSGTVTLSLPEGARTRKDSEVASLSDIEERQQAEARVSQLESELEAFNAGNAAEEKSLAGTILEASEAARSGAARLRAACLAGDFTAIDRALSELASLKRQQADAAARLAAIRRDRSALEEALAAARATLQQVVFPVAAPQAGYVSYSLDGLEETLTPDSIGRYTTKDIVTLPRREVVTTDKAKVQAGDPIARIVADSEAYVSAIVTNGDADRLAAVKEVTLRFPSFAGCREVKADLFHVGGRERNGYCLVTYRTQGVLEGMVSAREAEVGIVAHVYVGVVLPRRAVVRRGGQDGVFVLENGVVCRFRPVTIVGEAAGQVVVDGLKDGTQVVATPWLVTEGTRVGRRMGGGVLAWGG